MTTSDTYQQCIIDGLNAAKAAAKKAKTAIDPAVVQAANDATDANQNDKVAVGTAFNGAAKAYKAAHPAPAS